MSDKIHKLTVNADSTEILYVTKFLDLLENAYLYEKGEDKLKEIKDKLNSLKNKKLGDSSISCDEVGYGCNSDMKEVLHYKP